VLGSTFFIGDVYGLHKKQIPSFEALIVSDVLGSMLFLVTCLEACLILVTCLGAYFYLVMCMDYTKTECSF
jgi:hypothetical protein